MDWNVLVLCFRTAVQIWRHKWVLIHLGQEFLSFVLGNCLLLWIKTILMICVWLGCDFELLFWFWYWPAITGFWVWRWRNLPCRVNAYDVTNSIFWRWVIFLSVFTCRIVLMMGFDCWLVYVWYVWARRIVHHFIVVVIGELFPCCLSARKYSGYGGLEQMWRFVLNPLRGLNVLYLYEIVF